LGNEHPSGNSRRGKSDGRIPHSHGEILGSVLGEEHNPECAAYQELCLLYE